jgi:hypothetical protein
VIFVGSFEIMNIHNIPLKKKKKINITTWKLLHYLIKITLATITNAICIVINVVVCCMK